jgi:MbtH protein
MSSDNQDDTRTYLVVMNAEEQYSVWPLDKQIPPGWSAVGKQGRKADCLQYIDEVWTDMRPLSLRKQMQKSAGQAR